MEELKAWGGGASLIWAQFVRGKSGTQANHPSAMAFTHDSLDSASETFELVGH